MMMTSTGEDPTRHQSLTEPGDRSGMDDALMKAGAVAAAAQAPEVKLDAEVAAEDVVEVVAKVWSAESKEFPFPSLDLIAASLLL